MIIDFPVQGQYALNLTPDSSDQPERCCFPIDTLRDAYARYQHALVELTMHPADPACKQQALLHGRTYALLTRLQHDAALPRLNEFALMQAILAATAVTSPRGTTDSHLARRRRTG